MDIRFAIPFKCHFGQHLAVIGGPRQLGQWEAAAALPMTWQQGDVWAASLAWCAGCMGQTARQGFDEANSFSLGSAMLVANPMREVVACVARALEEQFHRMNRKIAPPSPFLVRPAISLDLHPHSCHALTRSIP